MTYYQILGIPQTATADQICAAYRKKAFEVHPDRNKSLNAHQQFIAIRLAYETLSNPKKRAKYDEKLKSQTASQMQSFAPSWNAHSYTFYSGTESSFEKDEYFNDIYYDPLDEWIKIYRLGWKEWRTIPLNVKLKKIAAELIFRSLYAVLGASFAIIIANFIFFGDRWLTHAAQDQSTRSAILSGIYIMAALFFIIAKGLGLAYRAFKDID